MRRTVKTLFGDRLLAGGERAGRAHDFRIDDQCWHVRYLVAEFAKWPGCRWVLAGRAAFEQADGDTQVLPVRMT